MASRNINLLMIHIPGVDNSQADALSRFQVETFRTLNPLANQHPDEVAHEVWLVLEQDDPLGTD